MLKTSNSQPNWDELREKIKAYHEENDEIRNECPECGEPYRKPARDMCTLNQAMHRYIPAGKHIHLKCPVHGSHRIEGPEPTMFYKGTSR